MLETIPFHKDVRVPKSQLPALPRSFEPTFLGYSRPGSLGQYRGPDGLHAHDYRDCWVIHRDYADPRTLAGAVAHLLMDAPELLIAATVAMGGGAVAMWGTRSLKAGLFWGGLLGLAAFSLAAICKQS